jgi:hypothetical protein
MRYRDKSGIRRRESTLTEDWGEAQKCLREQRNEEGDGTQIEQIFWNQQEVWSGRGDLNARPPAPKAVSQRFAKCPIFKVLVSLEMRTAC